jgi:Na+-driven multidrug efflux pump
LFFVLVCDMSVEGVAIATGTAAAVSAAVLFGNLMRDTGPCHFSFKTLKFTPAEAKKILWIGLPAGVQNSLFSISNIIIQSSIVQVNNMMCDPTVAYQPVVKGNAAAANIASFGNTALSAAGHAIVSFTSQNYGAKNYARVKRVAKNGFWLLSLVSIVATAVLMLLRDPLLSLYGVTDGADELSKLAYYAALTRVWYMWPFYILHGFMTCGSDVLRGLGKSMLSTVSSLIGSCVLRVIWIYTAFRAFPSLGMIYVSYPATWGLTAVVLFVFVFREFRRFPREETVSE